MQRLLTKFVLLLTAASAYGAEPETLSLEKPVSLTGTIVREFDMSFVDSDLGPIQDRKEVARAVAEARRKHPIQNTKPHEPVPHFILRLDRPVSIRTESLPEEHNISEVDLGSSAESVPEKELGKTRFVVSGRLSPAMTVHHLRPITMKVTALEHAR